MTVQTRRNGLIYELVDTGDGKQAWVLALQSGGTGAVNPVAARAALGTIADGDPRLFDPRPNITDDLNIHINNDETAHGDKTFTGEVTFVEPIVGSVTGNAATVSTNANLSGDVTSVGNATSIAAGVIVDNDVNATAGIAQSKIADLTTDLAAKAPLASPAFTGLMTVDGPIGLPSTASELNTVRHPGGGDTYGGASATGALKITLPGSWTGAMIRMHVKVYNYAYTAGAPPFDLWCGGFAYSLVGWARNPFAYIVADPHSALPDLTVRFGHDGTKCCVYVGELATAWAYAAVSIESVEVSYVGNAIGTWDDGWAIGFEASAFGTITATITHPLVGRYLDGQAIVKDNDARLTDARTPSNDASLVHTSGNETIGGDKKFSGKTGFNNTAAITKPVVTGSRGGNAALASLITAMSNYGLVTDSSSA